MPKKPTLVVVNSSFFTRKLDRCLRGVLPVVNKTTGDVKPLSVVSAHVDYNAKKSLISNLMILAGISKEKATEISKIKAKTKTRFVIEMEKSLQN